MSEPVEGGGEAYRSFNIPVVVRIDLSRFRLNFGSAIFKIYTLELNLYPSAKMWIAVSPL